MIAETVIIGLGNLYQRDDGIGVRVVNELIRRAALPPGVQAEELGMGGLAVLHALRGRRNGVLVDCAYMHEPPGTWRVFRPDEVDSRRVSMRYSLHEGDLLQTLALADQLGEGADEVRIIGIQPACVEPGEALSDPLQKHFEDYLRVAVNTATQCDPDVVMNDVS